jgi:hypothetical protein
MPVAYEQREFESEAALRDYILDLNAHRRNTSQGQKAMAVACICLETKQSMRAAAKASSLTAGRIAQASTVLRFAPEYVQGVKDNTIKLDAGAPGCCRPRPTSPTSTAPIRWRTSSRPTSIAGT